ncbi:hypothetical protein [Hymenobacter sp. UV11]|uniref:hypothetical protein n=1 Tax=Hymenobacter sp. UV11 TaxID=1849735 RepID=UPI0014152710|nr:hypothetical protein [Hymenobacter sp. UV11]
MLPANATVANLLNVCRWNDQGTSPTYRSWNQAYFDARPTDVLKVWRHLLS